MTLVYKSHSVYTSTESNIDGCNISCVFCIVQHGNWFRNKFIYLLNMTPLIALAPLTFTASVVNCDLI